MLLRIKSELAKELTRVVQERFQIEHEPVVEIPPRRELGDLAVPSALHLARSLKRNPRAIAEEIAEGLTLPPAVERVSVEGPGYLGFFLQRSHFTAELLETALIPPPTEKPLKVVVEHTNINPNKAAHIGHLRNAVLGDVLTSTLKALSFPVEVQNYIDDTGVQLADVIVGFVDLRGMSLEDVQALAEPFDFYCWDLYAEVGLWLEEDPSRSELRSRTLHALESGEGERAQVGNLVAKRIVHRHLATMARLGVGYDLLTRESEIIRLGFFDQAFEKLKATGAVRLETSGKNAGCWIMPLSESEAFAGLEDPDKVIVRSDGTVTYVGKDIAYQMWKFGVLGSDFTYHRWREEGVWETAATDAPEEAPSFGNGARVVNVIDARQSYLQKIVQAGLEALGYAEEAANSIHFAYEMVALSPAATRQLGVAGGRGEDSETVTLMSGRKGIGVKADDLLDQLENKARAGIAERNRELSEEELDALSRKIAVGALRFLMVKATTTRVIAFDFEEALNFEGETGPYLQYSMVREANIRRKLEAAGHSFEVDATRLRDQAGEIWADDLWDLNLSVSRISETLEKAAASLELSLVARHAIDLARKFHSIYHRHPILHESDETLRHTRLATMKIFRQGLGNLMEILGIPVPERM